MYKYESDETIYKLLRISILRKKSSETDFLAHARSSISLGVMNQAAFVLPSDAGKKLIFPH
jgi:hypothetical protein